MREFNRYRTLALMFRNMKKISVSTVDLYYDIVALMFYASIVALWEVTRYTITICWLLGWNN